MNHQIRNAIGRYKYFKDQDWSHVLALQTAHCTCRDVISFDQFKTIIRNNT